MNMMSTSPVRRLGWTLAATWLAASERPESRLSRLERTAVLPASPDAVFAFFSDAANLERLTPPWLKFRILTPLPVEMRVGLEIDYRIVIHGVPIPWRTRIDVWEQGRRFVDRQVIGPYRWWRHEHAFEAVPGGTRVTDRIEFRPRLDRLAGPIVRRDVDRIFAFRQAALYRLMPVGQLRTATRGDAFGSTSGDNTRNRWPSGEMPHSGS
jgi:ligand-binding SRPBCC domain-containing protein